MIIIDDERLLGCVEARLDDTSSINQIYRSNHLGCTNKNHFQYSMSKSKVISSDLMKIEV